MHEPQNVFEMKIDRDKDGNPFPVVSKISPQQLEALRMLECSEGWKIYRRILNQGAQGMFFSALAQGTSFKMAKIAGQVAGLNSAINQLGMILKLDKQDAEIVGGETKNYTHVHAKETEEKEI